MIKTVYLCCSSHVDIGYTHLPDEVRELQFQATGDVLQACVATQNRPEWERFRWTFESGWVVRNFLSRCTPDERLVFADLLTKKQIEITAFFTQFLPQLPGLEELIEVLRYTTELGRELGVPVVTANLNDIGGNSFAFPQVLARAGICYYLFGAGAWRIHCLQCSLPHLFWHEGPDGSRLLFYRLGCDKTLKPSACMYNCTLVGNQANIGGGLRNIGVAVTLPIYNCIIYSNNAPTGSNWYHNVEALMTSFTNCCTTPSNSAGWADGNITNDPIFVAYGNGYGTNHVAGNYRLQANSPCVNTGTNGSWTTTYPTDLDGRRRIDRLFGRVDMGAYEFIHKITLISGH